MENPNLIKQKSENDAWAAQKFVEFKLNMIIKEAHDQLNEIEGTLEDLMSRVKKEKPEIIFFMDKGARVFALPIHKYLSQTMKQPPEIYFTNDKGLKMKYVKNNLTPDETIKKYLGLEKTKIFFIDETYSSGFSAAVIMKIKEALKNKNIYYFALSQDIKGKPPAEANAEWHKENLAKIKKDKRFVVYPNKIETLFSKDLAALYVKDQELEGGEYITKPRKEKIIEPEDNALNSELGLETLDLTEISTGIPDEAMEAAYKKLLPKALKIIHKMVYEKLVSNKKNK